MKKPSPPRPKSPHRSIDDRTLAHVRGGSVTAPSTPTTVSASDDWNTPMA